MNTAEADLSEALLLRFYSFNALVSILVIGLNPYLTNGLSHHYQLVGSTFILGASGVIFKF